MTFFEHQERARTSTTKLVLLFALAVLVLAGSLSGAVAWLLWGFQHQGQGAFQWNAETQSNVAKVAALVLLIIAGAAFYRMAQLRGGGRAIAEQMGGRLLLRNNPTPEERRILNVVEEMAIASGVPVPPVYLIEDEAINAFAAGYHVRDAVIGITRGAIKFLKREELQGVIAHEFSHILNGDMRLNLRLIGWLHGILVLGLLGKALLRVRSSGYRSRNNKNEGGLVLVGLALFVLGYAGVFFGNLIKAAVSRQREFLADASGVQFTRYPGGLSGALQKIGGYPLGSRLLMPQVEEISHMMFGDSLITKRHVSWFATHPALPERIKRIDPRWNGEYINPFQLPEPSYSAIAEEEAAPTSTAAKTAALKDFAAVLIATVGQPSTQSVNLAQQQLQQMPTVLTTQVADANGACCVVYALLLAHSSAETVEQQKHLLAAALNSVEQLQVATLYKATQQLARPLHYPLLELTQPALLQLSPKQRTQFLQVLQQLVAADAVTNLFEWCVLQLLTHHLQPPAVASSRVDLSSCATHAELLLAGLARAGHIDTQQQQQAWQAACASAGFNTNAELPEPSKEQLTAALANLRTVKPLQLPRLLKAMVHCVQHDGQLTPVELELVRLTSALLDCPIPAIVVG